jgi:sensor histidine kinase YesM
MFKETRNWKNALILSLLLTLFWCLIGILWKVGSSSWVDVSNSRTDIFALIRMQFTISFTSFFSIFAFQFRIFDKQWKFRKKFWTSITGSILIAFIFFFLVTFIIRQFFNPLPIHRTAFFPGLMMLVGSIIITSMTILLTILLYIIGDREKQILENQKLSVENIRARYETLKSQLNPHFLFNTLNTLDGLIDKKRKKAHDYLQKLSSSFRYTLQNKEITTLKEELEFAETYACLMKIRYGANLNIRYAVDDNYHYWHIMPVSLQMLLENAIKHNVINGKHPLTIHIETTVNDSIKVSNSIQPKINTDAGEGIGLANLVERYHLLFGMEVMITNNGVFAVEIPLINQL